MAISVDWGTRVIFVPRADLAILQLLPTEIRALDLNAFRLALKDLEDDAAGIPFPDTHTHNAPITVGGVQLARVIEIINGYTVTFEDGQYAVNLVGANSNVGDRVNVNQVSVRSANSAGLVTSKEIERAAYDNQVYVDTLNGETGTVYPIGTKARPCSTLAAAQLIAANNSIDRLTVVGTLVVGAGESLDDWEVHGHGVTLNVWKTIITLTAGCTTANTLFDNCYVQGVQGGEVEFVECVLGVITNSHCSYRDCGMIGPITAPSGSFASHIKEMHDCYTGIAPFTFDQNGTAMDFRIVRFSGEMIFTNGTNAGAIAYVNLNGGTLTLDASCTAGTYIVSGIGNLVNNAVGPTVSVGNLIITGGVVTAGDKQDIADLVTGDAKTLTVGKFLALK